MCSSCWDCEALRLFFAFPSKSFLKRTKHLWEDRRDNMNKPLFNFLWEIGIFSDVEICFYHKYWMLQTSPTTNMALGLKATLSLLRVSNLKETVGTWVEALYYSWKERSPSDKFSAMCSMTKLIHFRCGVFLASFSVHTHTNQQNIMNTDVIRRIRKPVLSSVFNDLLNYHIVYHHSFQSRNSDVFLTQDVQVGL